MKILTCLEKRNLGKEVRLGQEAWNYQKILKRNFFKRLWTGESIILLVLLNLTFLKQFFFFWSSNRINFRTQKNLEFWNFFPWKHMKNLWGFWIRLHSYIFYTSLLRLRKPLWIKKDCREFFIDQYDSRIEKSPLSPLNFLFRSKRALEIDFGMRKSKDTPFLFI